MVASNINNPVFRSVEEKAKKKQEQQDQQIASKHAECLKLEAKLKEMLASVESREQKLLAAEEDVQVW
jgi:hypothetical protein